MAHNSLHAVISGDLIHSRKMKQERKELLYKDLAELLAKNEELGIQQGEISRGDFIQCLLDEPENALQCMLIIIMYLKTWPLDSEKKEPIQIRMAMGIAPVEFISATLAISDGEAFQQSGHLLDEIKKSTYHRLAVYVSIEEYQQTLSTLFVLLDACIRKITPVQAKVVYHKILGKKQSEIASELGMNQSVVSRHLQAANWQAIAAALKYFKNTISSIKA